MIEAIEYLRIRLSAVKGERGASAVEYGSAWSPSSPSSSSSPSAFSATTCRRSSTRPPPASAADGSDFEGRPPRCTAWRPSHYLEEACATGRIAGRRRHRAWRLGRRVRDPRRPHRDRHHRRGGVLRHAHRGPVPEDLRLRRQRPGPPPASHSLAPPGARSSTSHRASPTRAASRATGGARRSDPPRKCSTASATSAGCPGHHPPRADQRLRSPARVAHHDRQPTGLRLQEHDPPGLRLEPEQPGPARHREHVAGVGVGGHLLPGHSPGEHHRVTDPDAFGQPFQPAAVRPVTHQQQPRGRPAAQHRRPGPDQRVLALAAHQSRRTDDDGGVAAEPQAPAYVGTAAPREEPGRRRRPGRAAPSVSAAPGTEPGRSGPGTTR